MDADVARQLAELRRELAELRDREQDLSDFVNNASLGLHAVGPDGVILWANQAELDLLGYTREEYVGRHIHEFHADERTIADILTFCWCVIVDRNHFPGFPEWPQVKRWFDQIGARPAVQKGIRVPFDIFAPKE